MWAPEGWARAALCAFVLGCTGERCDPGARRACLRVTDGGARQSGYQACGARQTWSECVPVGACAGHGAALYARCDDEAACGPPGCAVCGGYGGVQNPEGHRVCYAFCEVDADCAPGSPAAGVAPRCILGQCALLCGAGSRCPNDARCLPWTSPAAGAEFPGFEGLCL
jgi:hypothetical protein